MDGQQRLTSLFQSLASGKPVQTQDVRKRAVAGWFYMDMRMALDPYADREEAILFLPADRVQRNFRGGITADYSAVEKEYEACLFPLAKIFEPDDWYTGFQEFWDFDRDKIKLWNSFNREVVWQFNRYQLPVIELNRDIYNPIVNKTPLTARTNGVIGGRAPSEYLERLANSAGVDTDTIRKHVSTHLADADLMERDDFEAFFATRARALLSEIASAMGKVIDDFNLPDAAGRQLRGS